MIILMLLILTACNMFINLTDMVFILMIAEILLLVFSLAKNWFHIIMMMLILELLSVALFKMTSLLILSWMSSILLLLMMVMMVIEASLGMSMIVSSTRAVGNSAMSI